MYDLTGKNPMTIRQHARMLVAADFSDGSFGIWTIGELMDPALTQNDE